MASSSSQLSSTPLEAEDVEDMLCCRAWTQRALICWYAHTSSSRSWKRRGENRILKSMGPGEKEIFFLAPKTTLDTGKKIKKE